MILDRSAEGEIVGFRAGDAVNEDGARVDADGAGEYEPVAVVATDKDIGALVAAQRVVAGADQIVAAAAVDAVFAGTAAASINVGCRGWSRRRSVES